MSDMVDAEWVCEETRYIPKHGSMKLGQVKPLPKKLAIQLKKQGLVKIVEKAKVQKTEGGKK